VATFGAVAVIARDRRAGITASSWRVRGCAARWTDAGLADRGGGRVRGDRGQLARRAPTEAALAAYPGGIVDRVVKLSNGEYNVHYIGVNWPHHVFVNQSFKVVGAG
jgi:hypothetical protein